MDERLCSDSVFRAIRLSPDVMVLSDVLILCGRNVHEKLTHTQRLQLLAELLESCHSPELTALVHPQELPVGTLVRGHEYYDEQPGSIGVFLPASE